MKVTSPARVVRMDKTIDKTITDVTRTLATGVTPLNRIAENVGWDTAKQYRRDLANVRWMWRIARMTEGVTWKPFQSPSDTIERIATEDAQRHYRNQREYHLRDGVEDVIVKAFAYLDARRVELEHLDVSEDDHLVTLRDSHHTVRKTGSAPFTHDQFDTLRGGRYHTQRGANHLVMVPGLTARLLELTYGRTRICPVPNITPDTWEAVAALWDPSKHWHETMGTLEKVLVAAELVNR